MNDLPASGDQAIGQLTEDAFLGGALQILQPQSGYRAGLDAVLLAAAASARDGDQVLDVGAGVGVVGLAAAHRLGGIKATLVEQNASLVAIARQNIDRNGLSVRVEAVVADVTRPLSAYPELSAMSGRIDHALANPPFLVEGRGSVAGDPVKAAANAMPAGTLARWAQFMAAMVRPGGTVTLIHRADALKDTLDALEGRFGGVVLVPAHSHAGKPASRVLVRATKGSRAPLELRPGVVLHEVDGGFRPEIEAVLRNGAAFKGFGDA